MILLTMPSLGNMAKVPTRSLLIFLLSTDAVLGCGTLPGSMRTWRFNVTGFSLPVAMAFSTDAAARAQVPQISPNSGSAEAFVKRLIVQGVHDVLEQQGRAAGLPDFVITNILSQLGIKVLYTPLSCPKVSVNPTRPSKFSNFQHPLRRLHAIRPNPIKDYLMISLTLIL
ncbi:hypothetical protein KIN20_030950 [Parelaphostrongylus tenuis]|uniref:Uncharacterized protein n=1 Tax=Parelaphostrongylus tenuis TaxID=148309 RepID=A0AAD5R4G1_PARTN|nr:hypothetical protein KIN20_030950 [Parelaphostrongylus tenuis]